METATNFNKDKICILQTHTFLKYPFITVKWILTDTGHHENWSQCNRSTLTVVFGTPDFQTDAETSVVEMTCLELAPKQGRGGCASETRLTTPANYCSWVMRTGYFIIHLYMFEISHIPKLYNFLQPHLVTECRTEQRSHIWHREF